MKTKLFLIIIFILTSNIFSLKISIRNIRYNFFTINKNNIENYILKTTGFIFSKNNVVLGNFKIVKENDFFYFLKTNYNKISILKNDNYIDLDKKPIIKTANKNLTSNIIKINKKKPNIYVKNLTFIPIGSYYILKNFMNYKNFNSILKLNDFIDSIQNETNKHKINILNISIVNQNKSYFIKNLYQHKVLCINDFGKTGYICIKNKNLIFKEVSQRTLKMFDFKVLITLDNKF